MLDLPKEVCGLVLGPEHPRPQMLKVGIYGRLEQRRIGRMPTPQHQPLGIDAIRRPLSAGYGTFPVCLLHSHACALPKRPYMVESMLSTSPLVAVDAPTPDSATAPHGKLPVA